jgi:hypothetical protein
MLQAMGSPSWERPVNGSEELPVDPEALRKQVREKYREVAIDPNATFYFHLGRALARHLGYEATEVDELPERAVESFPGVANPFSLRRLEPGERVVDVGSGAGFDSLIAAGQVGFRGPAPSRSTHTCSWRAALRSELISLTHMSR